jgi:hypothetical protein
VISRIRQSAGDLLGHVGAQDFLEKQLEILTRPPLIHVRLPKANRRLGEQSLIEQRIVYNDVPGIFPLEANASRGEKLADNSLGTLAAGLIRIHT